MVRVELTEGQYDVLLRLIRMKAREVWNWGVALNTTYRDREFNQIRSVLDALEKAEEKG